MKTNTLLITVALALCLTSMGCGNKANKVVVETKTAPTAPVELKLKWLVGRHAVQSLDLKQSNEMNVPGMPKPMMQEMTMGQNYSLSVLKERAGGGREVEMEFLDIRMTMKIGDTTQIDFDSTKKSPGKTDPVAAAFGKLAGAKILFLLDANNRVEKVEGVDDIKKRLMSGAGSDPTGVLESMFNEGTFKQMMDQAQNMPDKPVKPGDSWPVQREIEMGSLGTLVMDYTFTLQSWEKRNDRYCARIAFEGTTKSKSGATSNAQGVAISIQEGKSTGETWFDLDMGMFILTTMNGDMKLNITIPNPAAAQKPGTPKTQTITGLLNQNIITKLELK